MVPFKDSLRWESKQGANRVAHGGCIKWDFVCSDTTKYHICCGHQRHVVQCIELQVPQVGFCAGEYSMKSTLRGNSPLSVKEQVNLGIFDVGSSYTA